MYLFTGMHLTKKIMHTYSLWVFFVSGFYLKPVCGCVYVIKVKISVIQECLQLVSLKVYCSGASPIKQVFYISFDSYKNALFFTLLNNERLYW